MRFSPFTPVPHLQILPVPRARLVQHDTDEGDDDSTGSAGSAPWDPGVGGHSRRTLQRAPRSDASDVHAHRRVRQQAYPGSEDEIEEADANGGDDSIDMDDEDEDAPFVPSSSRGATALQPHHPPNRHPMYPAHMPGSHAAPSITHIATHPTYRINSDRDTDTRPGIQPAARRPRSDDYDPAETEERERYRPRPRRTIELDISLQLSTPLPLPTRVPHGSPPDIERSSRSPRSNSTSPRSPIDSASTTRPDRHLSYDSDPHRVDPGHRHHHEHEGSSKRSENPAGYHHSHAITNPHPSTVLDSSPTDHDRERSVSVESEELKPTPALPPQPVRQKTTLRSISPTTVPSQAPTQATSEAGGPGMLSDSELADETVHLRALLGSAPGAAVGLNALADPPPGEKPNYPLPTLIKLAIHGSPRGRLTLQEIYQALEDRFEWFRERTDEVAWKNSIRHNLSLRKCFLKVQRPITEPGKGSYWMIDLTQGEGNKRVRKRNKKPTKGQLAAQAAAEAYRASARLPGQGEGPRPEPYPPPTQSQATIADGREDIDYQVPLMRTNLVTAPAGADLRRFPRENVDSDANIDPALRDQPMYDSSSGKARSQLWGQGRPATGSQAISSHHLPSSAQTQPPPHRASSLSVSQPHPQSLQSAPHVQYASQQLPVQPTYQRSSSAPQPAYQYAVQPTAQHLVQSDVRVPHPTQTSPQPLPMHQLFPTLPSAQPHPAPQTQARLPPMRTLSGSPTPDIPSSNESQNTVPGFARFASVAVGFPKQSFGKPALAVPLAMPIRPLRPDSIDAARLRVEQSPGKGKGRAEPDSDSGERQSRRFVPPPPRAGLEHVNKGGLLSARRVSERYDEGSVDWLNRLDEDEGQSTFTQEPLEQSESVRVRGDEIA